MDERPFSLLSRAIARSSQTYLSLEPIFRNLPGMEESRQVRKGSGVEGAGIQGSLRLGTLLTSLSEQTLCRPLPPLPAHLHQSPGRHSPVLPLGPAAESFALKRETRLVCQGDPLYLGGLSSVAPPPLLLPALLRVRLGDHS